MNDRNPWSVKSDCAWSLLVVDYLLHKSGPFAFQCQLQVEVSSRLTSQLASSRGASHQTDLILCPFDSRHSHQDPILSNIRQHASATCVLPWNFDILVESWSKLLYIATRAQCFVNFQRSLFQVSSRVRHIPIKFLLPIHKWINRSFLKGAQSYSGYFDIYIIIFK